MCVCVCADYINTNICICMYTYSICATNDATISWIICAKFNLYLHRAQNCGEQIKNKMTINELVANIFGKNSKSDHFNDRPLTHCEGKNACVSALTYFWFSYLPSDSLEL